MSYIYEICCTKWDQILGREYVFSTMDVRERLFDGAIGDRHIAVNQIIQKADNFTSEPRNENL